MPRTKRRFNDNDKPESEDSINNSNNNSTNEEEIPQESITTTTTTYRGGKQLSHMVGRGGGKQIRTMPASDDDDDDDSDDSVEEDSNELQQQYRGGKQFRPASRGKILRYPPPAEGDDSNDDSDDDDDDDDNINMEEEEEEVEVIRPQIYGVRGGGKKLLRYRAQESDDDNEEETNNYNKPIVLPGTARGGGKVLRPIVQEEDDDDDEDKVDDNDLETMKPSATNKLTEDNDMDIDSESEEESTPVPPPPKRAATRATRRSTRATRKVVEESEDEDMEESSDEDMEDSEEDSSDDDSSDDEREFNLDTLDQNDLIEGDEDQKYLDSLPEIERESILAERFDKKKAELEMKRALRENKRREKEQKRLQSGKSKGKKKLQKKTKGKSKNAKSKKADTSKDHQIAKKIGLGRAAKQPSGLESKRQAALAQLRKDRKSSKYDEDSDLDDYGENDDDDSDEDYAESKPWMKSKTKKKAAKTYSSSEDEGFGGKAKTFVEADLSDFMKVTIPRRRLSRWCNEPFFEKAVLNFYVKLAIGRDEMTQKPCYRLCKIIGVKEGKQYQFPPYKNQPVITTNKWLNLKFGDSIKYFKMIMISDSRPDNNDVNLYLNQLKNRRGGSSDVLSKKEASSLRKKQDNLLNNYTYTDVDVEKAIEVAKNLNKKISNIGAEKTKVNIAVQAARSALEDALKEKSYLETKRIEVEEDDEEEIDKELDSVCKKIDSLNEELDRRLTEQKKVLDAEALRIQQLKSNEKNRKWAKVNERAIAANKAADMEAYKIELAAQKSGQKESANPYARRKVKPRNLWNVGQDDKDTTNDISEKKIDEEVAVLNQDEMKESVDNSRDLRNSLKKKLSEQINEMSIDEEAIPKLMMSNTKKPITSRVRKGISLSEYFDRKAAGTL